MRQDVEASAVGHADQDVPKFGARRPADHFVEHGYQDSEAFDRESGLAGKSAVQEELEYSFLSEALEERHFIDRIGRRTKDAGLGRYPQPLPLLRVAQVGVVIAGHG